MFAFFSNHKVAASQYSAYTNPLIEWIWKFGFVILITNILKVPPARENIIDVFLVLCCFVNCENLLSIFISKG